MIVQGESRIWDDIAEILLKTELNTINKIKSINHLKQYEISLSFIQISNVELKVLIFTADVKC